MPEGLPKIIYVAGLIMAIVIRAPYSRRWRREMIEMDRMTLTDWLLLTFSSLGLVVIPVAYLVTFSLSFADYHLPAWSALVGGALFAAALMLFGRAHADLGRNFSRWLQIRRGHALVTHGVYRFVRHPIYTAHILWGIAQPLLLHNWIAGFSLLVVLVPMFLYRIPREEEMMLERFGDEYRSYMDRTGSLVPRLGR
jgi:protein-S-isoprenylcysteine O-methyltransferase Ste14